MQLQLIVSEASCLYFSLEELIHISVQSGVSMVQLREKNKSKNEVLIIAKKIKAILQPYAIPLIINDYVNIAAEIDAEGVHLGQGDMSYFQARKILGEKKIIGLTVENKSQAFAANQWQINYIGVGPVFATQTKTDALSPMGVEILQEISLITKHPIIAVGGINEKNISQILTTKIYGLAVSAAICHATAPARVINALKESICQKNIAAY